MVVLSTAGVSHHGLWWATCKLTQQNWLYSPINSNCASMSSPRRRRVLSFAMRHLLAETPRSNRTRLAHRLKRSPFSSRGSRRGIVCSRQQLRRHGMEVLKVRRCLDLYSCVGEAEGPLTVTEAVPLAEIHALDVVKSPGPESL